MIKHLGALANYIYSNGFEKFGSDMLEMLRQNDSYIVPAMGALYKGQAVLVAETEWPNLERASIHGLAGKVIENIGATIISPSPSIVYYKDKKPYLLNVATYVKKQIIPYEPVSLEKRAEMVQKVTAQTEDLPIAGIVLPRWGSDLPRNHPAVREDKTRVMREVFSNYDTTRRRILSRTTHLPPMVFNVHLDENKRIPYHLLAAHLDRAVVNTTR
jgi:hypothetical protein